jgi:hypothetical protein
MTKEIEVIQKNMNPIVERAKLLSITDSKGMTLAVETLSQLNKIIDKITEEKERVTKPLNEALRAERSRWKPYELVCEEGIASLRQKMSHYQTEQEELRKEAEAKIAARIGEGKGKLKLDTAARQLSQIEKAPDEIATGSGSVQFRVKKELEIIDASLIPRAYLIPDEDLIFAALKAGKTITGTRIVEKQIPVNFR